MNRLIRSDSGFSQQLKENLSMKVIGLVVVDMEKEFIGVRMVRGIKGIGV